MSLVLTPASGTSIWHCCTLPTLYTSMIAREVKMRLLMMSSVLASNFARKVSLWLISLEFPAWMHSAFNRLTFFDIFSEITNSTYTCLLAHSIFRCSSGSQVISMDSGTCIGLAYGESVFLLLSIQRMRDKCMTPPIHIHGSDDHLPCHGQIV